MVCLWWLPFLYAGRYNLTVLDLLVWKSKEGSFTSLIGSLTLHRTVFTYVWDRYLAQCNFMLSVQFHLSFWLAQMCIIMMFTLGCAKVPIIRANMQTTQKRCHLFCLKQTVQHFYFPTSPDRYLCHSQIWKRKLERYQVCPKFSTHALSHTSSDKISSAFSGLYLDLDCCAPSPVTTTLSR